MKKLIILLLTLGLSTSLFAQSRKYISQFSHLQGYYNPALTGYEGSMLRGFVRNQWAGWEGAPMTYFASAELDFGQLSGQASGDILGKNAAGISILHDQYGAFAETEFVASYASRIQVGEKTNLRLGAGLNYRSIRLDGNSLTTEQADDPIVGQYFGSFSNMQVLDFNLGLALTHPSYYVSYAVHHVNQGAMSSGDVFMERMPRVGIFQAGYRNRINSNLALATNFLYRSQSDLPDNLELNLKVVGREIEVYNAISPNGDGLNDVLVIRNIGMYPSNELLIFNRRGQVVYDTRGYGQGNTFFDGRDKQGGLLPSGQYFYALTITTASGEQQLKGTVFISY